jgi:hypothetical protein
LSLDDGFQVAHFLARGTEAYETRDVCTLEGPWAVAFRDGRVAADALQSGTDPKEHLRIILVEFVQDAFRLNLVAPSVS